MKIDELKDTIGSFGVKKGKFDSGSDLIRRAQDFPYYEPIDGNFAKACSQQKQRIRYAAEDLIKRKLPDDSVYEECVNALNGYSRLSYKDICIFASSVSDFAKKYFCAEVFLKFKADLSGTINSADVLRYIQRVIDVENVMIELSSYSESHSKLTEQELERYIYANIMNTRALRHMSDSFFDYYTFGAVRKFFFLLDSSRRKTVGIKQIAHSAVMRELFFIRRSDYYENEMDLNMFEDLMANNWFSADKSFRMYSLYSNLDVDQNGLLNKDELLAFTGCTKEHQKYQLYLTPSCIGRLFDCYVTHQPLEMDYKGFLDLVLALENKEGIESLRYFWRLFCIDGDEGVNNTKLTPFVIGYFYKDIQRMHIEIFQSEAPPLDTIVMEIWDVLGWQDTEHTGIGFEDFVKSGQGHVVISMLMDVNGFWVYDNRESLMQEKDTGEDKDNTANEAGTLQLQYEIQAEKDNVD